MMDMGKVHKRTRVYIRNTGDRGVGCLDTGVCLFDIMKKLT